MKMFWFFVVIVGVLVMTIGFSNIKITDIINFTLPTGSYELKQAAYGSDKRQSLDIYLPKERTTKPPIVFVYGGAWKEGSKADYEFVAHALVGMGHTVIIPDYRLYPAVMFPAFIDDVADAIAYVETNASQLLGTPLQDFILMGHSAGAHSAALLTTDNRYLQTRNIQAQQVGLIALSGPYDLPLDDPEVQPIFPNADPQQVKPIRQVHADLPPTLLLHGAADERVKPLHTKSFNTALQQAGVSVQMKMYEGVNHTRIIGSLALQLRMLNNTYNDMKNFLQTIR
jgi:acetyl esterase/lipase